MNYGSTLKISIKKKSVFLLQSQREAVKVQLQSNA